MITRQDAQIYFNENMKYYGGHYENLTVTQYAGAYTSDSGYGAKVATESDIVDELFYQMRMKELQCTNFGE